MHSRDIQRLFAAADCCQQLRTVDLTDNYLQLDQRDLDGAGWNQSLQSAGQNWKQLRCLLLAKPHLHPSGMVKLMTAAQQWEQLQVLDLSTNSISEEGALVLAAAAPHWPELQWLSLRYCYVGDVGGQTLAAACKH